MQNHYKVKKMLKKKVNLKFKIIKMQKKNV